MSDTENLKQQRDEAIEVAVNLHDIAMKALGQKRSMLWKELREERATLQTLMDKQDG